MPDKRHNFSDGIDGGAYISGYERTLWSRFRSALLREEVIKVDRAVLASESRINDILRGAKNKRVTLVDGDIYFPIEKGFVRTNIGSNGSYAEKNFFSLFPEPDYSSGMWELKGAAAGAFAWLASNLVIIGAGAVSTGVEYGAIGVGVAFGTMGYLASKYLPSIEASECE